jgi:hypothetical protein
MKNRASIVFGLALGLAGMTVLGCGKSDADKAADQMGAAAHSADASAQQSSANGSASNAAQSMGNAANQMGDAAKAEMNAAQQKMDQAKDNMAANATTAPSMNNMGNMTVPAKPQ